MNTICIPKDRLHSTSRQSAWLPLAAILAILCIGVFSAILMPSPAFAQPDTTCVYESIRIHEGDTLWGIADQYRTEGMDIRSYVQEIRSLNQLSSDQIYEGEYLIIPIQKQWHEIQSEAE